MWFQVASLDGVLDNSITDYSGGEAGIQIVRLGEVNVAATEQLRVPAGKLEDLCCGLTAPGNSLFPNVFGLHVGSEKRVEHFDARRELEERTVVWSVTIPQG